MKQKFRQNVAAIELLRSIESARRPATRAEKSILVKYVGWGGLPQVFAESKEAPEWRREQSRLKDLLSDEEYRSARASTLNAHYTSPVVIRGMYAALERLGFQHGKILEPACGLGHFIGFMPAAMQERSAITGIELDDLTARLAKTIYPDADIRAQSFESAVLPTNSFDLALSNVPFGDYQPFDAKLNLHKFRIHDYFFVAALARVRPGGLVMFITSRGTLDKRTDTVRQQLAAQADLVGAIRLPNTAFKENANTEVTTDIVILRKRAPGEAPNGPAWMESRPARVEGGECFLNEYFQAQPRMMLGRMQLAHGMYGRNEPELIPDGGDLVLALGEAVARLPSAIYQAMPVSGAVRQTIPATESVKSNAYTVTDDGRVARREGDETALLPGLPEQTARRIRGLIRVRDSVRECLRTQVENLPEAEVEHARLRLNQDYDHFVAKFGAVSQSANVRAFAGDPDLPLLLSLENYDDETGVALKTAVFRERTVQRQVPVEAVATAKEALVVSLNEKGRVDLAHMSRLLGRPSEAFLPELRGVIFQNPATGRWESEDAYLSGNVREKLGTAVEAAKREAGFQINVEALHAVQPVDLKATEIDARLGSVWIPTEDVASFVRELLGAEPHDTESVRVSHAPQLGLWSVQVGYYLKRSVANVTEWGTDRVAASDLIEDALNLRTPTVYDLDANRNPVVNAAATEAARERQQKLKDRFSEWIWQDDARRERLVHSYNRDFNCIRQRSFSGEHLTLPGASPTITLRPHQKAAVWRILQTPNTLLAHVVGAGKTYTMVAGAMELKRLGLARKPMFVVPNHMLGQFSSELLTLYPGANILAAGKADFESHRRRQLMGRIATNNWDAVIVTHSGFERLPMSVKAQRKFVEEQLVELEDGIREHKTSSNSRIVKDLERAKKRLEAKLQNLAAEHRKDNTLTFEELGVDRLFVDEAQAYKNLFYVTKMTRVAGLPQSASERAFDMFLKVQHVQRLNGGGGVVFATGTPVTNTMAELYTLQRFLQMDTLRQRRLQHFDSWAATFGETVTAMELSPDGSGYRLKTRFARFVNVPELMQQFRQVSDIQTAAMLKLPVPALHEGKAQVVRATSTPELKDLVESLAKRAEKLRTSHVDPSDDNMLKITGEGRKAALDLRLVRWQAPDHAESKVNLATKEILSIWHETRHQRLTQMVFCDLSTPKAEGRGFSVYQDIKAKLVAGGVSADEIAFIQDHYSDVAKATLFRDVRAGKVRVLMGSTQKMGAGTNAQTLLVALHHLDAPWRPADIEQREGRILRQGNTNATVRVFRYVTEGSFDAYMWQTLETKAKFITQIMSGESVTRRIEDLDSPALTYAEVKAIASGNPLVIEKAKVDAEVMRLSRLRSEHDEEQFRLRRNVRFFEEEIPRVERQIAGLRADAAARQNTRGDAFRITLNGRTFTERPVAGEALIHLVDRHARTPQPVILGDLAGFRIEFRSTLPDTLTLHGAMRHPAKVSVSPIGIIMSLEHAVHSIEDRIAARETDLAQYRKSQGELTGHLGKSFEHEAHYRDLIARQSELVAALDITRNQAPSELAAGAGEVVENVAVEINQGAKAAEVPAMRVAV